MKTILILLLLSVQPVQSSLDQDDDRVYKYDTDYAEVNYRANNLFLLKRILDEMRIIRCQNEEIESDFCIKLNNKEMVK